MKKLLGFLAVMITALFVLGACGQSTKSTPSTEEKTITIKVGLTDGTSDILAPVEISVPKGKKLSELLDDPKLVTEIQKKLNISNGLEYVKGSDTYIVNIAKIYSNVEATEEISMETVVKAGDTAYLKATKK